MRVKVELISGVEGYCIAINDRRICGPKPWGGGTVTRTWTVLSETIIDALPKKDKHKKKEGE